MSVIVTINVKADGAKLEAWAAANQDTLTGIRAKAEEHGLIAHRFYGDDAGGIMVLDEWPDAGSFQAFFQGTMDQIGPMMSAVGAEGEPEVRFWNELETHDQYGWGA